MKHPRLRRLVAIAWLVGVAAAMVAPAGQALIWLLPISVVATAALLVRVLRTGAWALPVAAVAGLDPDAGALRGGLVLLAVVASMLAIGLLDAWGDTGPDRTEARVADPAGLAHWRSERRPALVRLGGGALVAAGAWAVLAAWSWSSPGWLLALMPAVAVLTVAAAGWPLWRPAPRQ